MVYTQYNVCLFTLCIYTYTHTYNHLLSIYKHIHLCTQLRHCKTVINFEIYLCWSFANPAPLPYSPPVSLVGQTLQNGVFASHPCRREYLHIFAHLNYQFCYHGFAQPLPETRFVCTWVFFFKPSGLLLKMMQKEYVHKCKKQKCFLTGTTASPSSSSEKLTEWCWCMMSLQNTPSQTCGTGWVVSR